jgi:aerobic carbon-monoxide dehydrogenase large subunit
MPRASDFCAFDVGDISTPTERNPLGVKGAGEAGAVGALAAVSNAVMDALAPLGITNLDMPATPARVWQALQRHGSKERS